MIGGTRRDRRGWTAASALAILVACAALGGCGGDEDGQRQGPAGDSPTAVESTVERIARIVAEARQPDDCEPLQPIQRRASVSLTCPGDRQLRRSMAKLAVTGVEVHGTAAVVDYTSGALEDGGSVVFLRDPDGRWGIARFGLVYERTVGTGDEDVRPRFDATVDAYLRAVRDRDCALYREHAGLETADVRTVCTREFARTASLARALEANPGTKAAYLGGNGSFGFYGLSFTSPRPSYTTLFVARTAPGSLRDAVVVAAAPGPVAEAESVRSTTAALYRDIAAGRVEGICGALSATARRQVAERVPGGTTMAVGERTCEGSMERFLAVAAQSGLAAQAGAASVGRADVEGDTATVTVSVGGTSGEVRLTREGRRWVFGAGAVAP